MYLVNRCKASADQFASGLKSVPAVFEAIMKNPITFSLLFTATEPAAFGASELRDLCCFRFSPEGSNNRIAEEATAYWWEVMLDGFDGVRAGFLAGDLLQFVTGSKVPPPAGFESRISIDFYTQEGGEKRLPHSSTCALVINLPRGLSSEEELQTLL